MALTDVDLGWRFMNCGRVLRLCFAALLLALLQARTDL